MELQHKLKSTVTFIPKKIRWQIWINNVETVINKLVTKTNLSWCKGGVSSVGIKNQNNENRVCGQKITPTLPDPYQTVTDVSKCHVGHAHTSFSTKRWRAPVIVLYSWVGSILLSVFNEFGPLGQAFPSFILLWDNSKLESYYE